MRVRRRVAAVMTVSAAIVALAVAPPAQAMTAGWTVESTPVPSVANASLYSVSCTSTDSCVAVGSYIAGDGHQRPFADIGSETTLAASYPAAPSSRATGVRLNDVSCIAPTAGAIYCVAVGSYGLGTALHSLNETWNGSRWRLQSDALPASELTSVTCVSTTFCVALAGRSGQPQIETWDGQSWALAFTASDEELDDLACRSATSCVAVGRAYDDQTSQWTPVTAIWDGVAWTTQTAANPYPTQGVELDGVSCVATGCVAVGGHDQNTLAETWDGSTWTVTPTPKRLGELLAVSCALSTSCLTVGVGHTTSGANGMLTEAWNGSTWRQVPGPSPDPWPELESRPSVGIDCVALTSCEVATSGPLGPYVAHREQQSWLLSSAGSGTGAATTEIQDVACADNICAAVGSSYVPDGHPFVEWNDGGSWHPIVLDPDVATTDAALFAVSCASASFCVATGELDRDDSVGISEVWNGQSWTEIPLPAASGVSRGITSISCPAVNLCFAAGGQEDQTTFQSTPLIERFDGTTWTLDSAPSVTGDSALQSISCASATTCAVQGFANSSNGQASFLAVRNGVSWSFTPIDGNLGSLSDVACPATNRCIAVGGTYGRTAGALIETYDGSTWSQQPAATGRGSSLRTVACRSVSDCLAVGSKLGHNGFDVPLAAAWNGTTWSLTSAPVAPTGVQNYGFEGVAASSGSSYVAAGNSAADTSQPLVERYA